MFEVIEFIGILQENFVPESLTELYINIPIAILDYKELVANNQPESSVSLRFTEADNLTMFDYERLRCKLRQLLKEEHSFYE